MRSLVSSSAPCPEGGLEPTAQDSSPMEACQLSLGSVRLLWALEGEAFGLLWAAIAPSLADLHRRSYVPRAAAVSGLFLACYAKGLMAAEAVEAAEVHEILSFVEGKALAAIGQGRLGGQRLGRSPCEAGGRGPRSTLGVPLCPGPAAVLAPLTDLPAAAAPQGSPPGGRAEHGRWRAQPCGGRHALGGRGAQAGHAGA